MIEIKSEIIKEFIYKKNYNYVVYIKETINTYESYLQNEDYGVIGLMFRKRKKETKLDNFISLVNENLERYIKIYKEGYEEENLKIVLY